MEAIPPPTPIPNGPPFRRASSPENGAREKIARDLSRIELCNDTQNIAFSVLLVILQKADHVSYISAALIRVGPPIAGGSRSRAPDSGARYVHDYVEANRMGCASESTSAATTQWSGALSKVLPQVPQFEIKKKCARFSKPLGCDVAGNINAPPSQGPRRLESIIIEESAVIDFPGYLLSSYITARPISPSRRRTAADTYLLPAQAREQTGKNPRTSKRGTFKTSRES
ncbi:hypothetical protein EVAR_19377_1 [Eumeta japonica]|uniref:Uncharacterized protein n=1 Tax=Eumeta variegata TaxID=151549 RepID=A0A4C1TRF8_EUMVA|nr:hypothetical protein EVAR_19377_1 [Eumeta japonica]